MPAAVRREQPAATGAIRGAVLTYSGDPFHEGLGPTLRYEPDAIVAMAHGRIAQVGPAQQVRPLLPPVPGLSIPMTLADDRAVRATYVAGRKVFRRA